MKNKSKFLIVFLLVIICLITCKYITKHNELFKGKTERTIIISYEKEQEKVDEELKKYVFDKRITINSPKVIVDPYNASPLTAIIIFYTKYSTSIKLYINDIYMTTIESSKSHVIPVYGLRENYNNKVIIEDDKGNRSEVYIATDSIKDSDFYTYNTKFNDNTQLFLNTPYGKYAIDNNGYISWFINNNALSMDISDDNEIYNIDINKNFVVTDFMGRVYKKYYTNIIFDDHKIKKLDNGDIIGIRGYNFITVMDSITGECNDIIDVTEILKKVDDSIIIDPTKSYLNHFEYNEIDNTILLSIRGLNCIINYDLNKDEIIWIFSNSTLSSSKFDKYKLKLTSGNYFIGQHTPYLKGKYLYLFDNGIFKTGIVDSDDKGTSSAVIYEINGREIKEIYRYNSKYLSGWYGSFYDENGIKNINYGCIINNDNGKYSKIIELDNDDNIITDFTTDYDSKLIYQSYRNTFYKEKTPNYNLNIKYETYVSDIDNVKHDFNLYEVNYYKSDKYFKKNIKSSMIDETLIMLNNDVLETNAPQEFELLFVDNNYNHYNMVINNGYTVISIRDLFFSQIRGKYAIYIKIKEKYYNTNLVLNIV